MEFSKQREECGDIFMPGILHCITGVPGTRTRSYLLLYVNRMYTTTTRYILYDSTKFEQTRYYWLYDVGRTFCASSRSSLAR